MQAAKRPHHCKTIPPQVMPAGIPSSRGVASQCPKLPSQPNRHPFGCSRHQHGPHETNGYHFRGALVLATPSLRANDSLPESCTRVQVPPCASSKHLRLPCPVARASRGNDGRHRPKVRGDGDMDCRRRVCYRDYHLHRVSLSIQRAVLPLFPLRKTDFVLSSSIWLQTYDPISPILRRDDARSGTDGRTGRTIGSRFCSDTSFAFC